MGRKWFAVYRKQVMGVGFVTPEELKFAIKQTRIKIYETRQQIEAAGNPEEKRRLKRRLKELQYLQLWHLDQLS